ncbi:HNH endonuclease [Synechococcales cyanobacterium C]|uniref:HNH endonuclease n=1 Tax=Petrachloros mirabilis ULC683 TaxID=2781853 RepID=A0A8K1ZZM3_9CYAN|nr:HNH endonuclease signature motif containing protein [Petrachloros mirabilis]NCJ06637.1 HNH endonuclease [Petrachloros mirabilis ULC683]
MQQSKPDWIQQSFHQLQKYQDLAAKIRHKYRPRRRFERWRDSQDGQAWKQQQFNRIQGICPDCGHQLPAIAHFQIDHIKPLKTHPDLATDLSNLQLLCGPCNQRKACQIKPPKK